MNMKHISTIAGAVLLTASVQAQYGLIDNHTGVDRNPADVNVSEGPNGFFSFGAFGGGAGELADQGPNGVGDTSINGGAGGDYGAGGGFGYSWSLNSPIDRTASINGMTNTGYTLDFKDIDGTPGDGYALRIETGTAPNSFGRSETINFADAATSASIGNGWTRLTFTPGTGTIDTSQGAFDETEVATLTVIGTSFAEGLNGGATFQFDNIGFTGNLVPTSGFVTDFSEQTAGSVTIVDSDAGVPLPVTNNFGGTVEVFSFGDGEVTAIDVISSGGDNALQFAAALDTAGGAAGFGGGGILIDLGPLTGSQTDVQNFDALSINIGIGQVGDVIDVLIEDINAPTFGDRCSFTITATDTNVNNYIIPFSSFTCGAQGPISSNSDAVSRVTILLNNDNGDGTTVTVDDIGLFDTSSSVDSWNQF